MPIIARRTGHCGGWRSCRWQTRFSGGIAQALAGWFPEARLAVDIDRVTALSEDRERLWRQVSGADFLSDEEKRAMLGIVS